MKIMVILMTALLTSASFAQNVNKLVSEKVVTLPVDISKAKLKFTNIGYGQTYFVKIIVPELAAETIMNHRNVGEDGPCLFTNDTRKLEDVIQDNPSVEQADFKIRLTKTGFVNKEGVCKLQLNEELSVDLRGFHFQHMRTTNLPDRIAADCL